MRMRLMIRLVIVVLGVLTTPSRAAADPEELLPGIFQREVFDSAAMYDWLRRAGPVSLEEWRIAVRAHDDYLDALDAIRPDAQAFMDEHHAQYFLNYPPIKPDAVEAAHRAIRTRAVTARSELHARLVEAAPGLAPHVAFVERTWTWRSVRGLRLHLANSIGRPPDLPGLVDALPLTAAERRAAEAIVARHDAAFTIALAQAHEMYSTARDGLLAAWASTGRDLEPPYHDHDWDPDAKQEAEAIWRSRIAPAEQALASALRTPDAALRELAEVLPPAAHDELSKQVLVHQWDRWTPRDVRRARRLVTTCADRTWPDEATTAAVRSLIDGWEAADLGLLRELGDSALRHPEIRWPYHHRSTPVDPRVAARQLALQAKRVERARQFTASMSKIDVSAGALSPQASSDEDRRPKRRTYLRLDDKAPLRAFREPGSARGLGWPTAAGPDESWWAGAAAALGLASDDPVLSSIRSSDVAARAARQRAAGHLTGGLAWMATEDPVKSAADARERERLEDEAAAAEAALIEALTVLAATMDRMDAVAPWLAARRLEVAGRVTTYQSVLTSLDQRSDLNPAALLLELDLPAETQAAAWAAMSRPMAALVEARESRWRVITDAHRAYRETERRYKYERKGAAAEQWAARVVATMAHMGAMRASSEASVAALSGACLDAAAEVLDPMAEARWRSAAQRRSYGRLWSQGVDVEALATSLSAGVDASTATTIAAIRDEALRAQSAWLARMIEVVVAHETAAPMLEEDDWAGRRLKPYRVRFSEAGYRAAAAMALASEESERDERDGAGAGVSEADQGLSNGR